MLAASTYAAIVRPLQVLVLLVAALFFVRILRVASVQMRPEGDDTTRGRRTKSLALTFVEPTERAGERVALRESLLLGRSATCDLVLDDTFLSGRHAQITEESGDFFIEDLGSTNGTYVNAELLTQRTQLLRGDVLQIGNVIFEVTR